MTTKEKEYRINYWYIQGKKLYAEWLRTKEKRFWDAFGCCASAIAEFDRNHKDERTQYLQARAWKGAWIYGEVSLQEWQDSGYFDEIFYNLVTCEA